METIEKVIKTEKVKTEDVFWQKNEWTPGFILMRVLGYGFTVVFLYIIVLCLYKGIELGYPLLAASIASVTYVASDLLIIREKNRRKE